MSYAKTDPNKAPAKKEFAKLYAQGDPSKGIKPSNATQAYLATHGGSQRSAIQRGYELVRNRDVAADIAEQRKKIEVHADKAIDQLASLSQGAKSEMVRYSASSYLTDQAHGKATQRLETVSVTANISMDLSGGKAGPVPREVLDKLKE